MEVQGASCDEVDIDLKGFLGLNDAKDFDSLDKLHKSLTPEKWNALEEHLNKRLTKDQLHRALTILRPLRIDSTEEDKVNSSVSLS